MASQATIDSAELAIARASSDPRPRCPTIAVLAVDGINAKGLAALDALGRADSRPAILLIGALSARVLASAKRTARARGLPVLGVASRPLDTLHIERLLAPHGSVRHNAFVLKFWHDPYEITLFPDGRAIIKGTTDTAVARSLYAKYIGS